MKPDPRFLDMTNWQLIEMAASLRCQLHKHKDAGDAGLRDAINRELWRRKQVDATLMRLCLGVI
ncbi:MAG TPA: hypothetical protein VKZ50_16780 [bacterium]|nr:hypothetical protein [bacterium]